MRTSRDVSPKTLFIVGAGASKELLLPLGDELKDKIAQRLRLEQGGASRTFADEAINSALVAHIKKTISRESRGAAIERYRHAATVIIGALPLAQSIDNLLKAHSGNAEVEQLGKIGIASAIIQAEHESALGNGFGRGIRVASNLNRDEVLGSWYSRLARLLFAGARKDDVGTLFDDVTFIVFNYDRCLELFLYEAVRTYFDLDDAAAVSAVRRARFIHPYGQVGFLPWQQGAVQTAFGNVGVAHLVEVSQGIETFSESADSVVRDEIAKAMSQAATLIFTGFGFIDQNMELLQASEEKAAVTRVPDQLRHLRVGRSSRDRPHRRYDRQKGNIPIASRLRASQLLGPCRTRNLRQPDGQSSVPPHARRRAVTGQRHPVGEVFA